MRALAILGAAALFLGASVAAVAEPVKGAGSSFAFPVIAKWAQAYALAKADGGDFIPFDAGVDYEPIGSLGGVTRVNQLGIDFGATDSPLRSEDLAKLGLGQFPIVMGGVVPVVNLDGVGPGGIKFTGALLADIYLGKVRTWSDPAIKALNPEVELPDVPIAVIHRADGSGTTFNFADFLARHSAEWREKVGVDLMLKWPVGTGAEGTGGVARKVRETKNAIGYVEYGLVARTNQPYGLVRNRAGKFVKPDAASLQAAAASADWANAGDFHLLLTDAPGAEAYPMAATVFVLMQKHPRSAARSRDALDFFRLSLEKGQKDAADLGYVPLPEPLVNQVKAYWASTFKFSS